MCIPTTLPVEIDMGREWREYRGMEIYMHSHWIGFILSTYFCQVGKSPARTCSCIWHGEAAGSGCVSVSALYGAAAGDEIYLCSCW